MGEGPGHEHGESYFLEKFLLFRGKFDCLPSTFPGSLEHSPCGKVTDKGFSQLGLKTDVGPSRPPPSHVVSPPWPG